MKLSNDTLMGATSGTLLGLGLSVFREQLIHFPMFVILDTPGIWAFYFSNNLLIAGVVTTIYFGAVFFLAAWLLVSRRLRLLLVGLLCLVSLHILLIWRLDVLLAPYAGQIPQFLLSR